MQRNNKIRVCSLVLSLLAMMLLSGCPKYIGGPPPQNPEQFVATYKNWAGPFGGIEHYTIDRPIKSVIADMRLYAKTCLRVRTEDQLRGEGRHSTTYNTKIGTGRNGVMMLSVQHLYDDRLNEQEPPGGQYTLVAEFRADGKAKTRIDLYRIGDSRVAEVLKEWATGPKEYCPNL